MKINRAYRAHLSSAAWKVFCHQVKAREALEGIESEDPCCWYPSCVVPRRRTACVSPR
jgi:hypothetical protein